MYGDPTDAIDKFYPTQNYNGWSSACNTCSIQYIMSIAQKGTKLNSGSLYGPVSVLYGPELLYFRNSCFCYAFWSSSVNLGCQNYPTWLNGDEEQECYNGPPSGALSKVITVSNWNASSSGTTQTMTISTK